MSALAKLVTQTDQITIFEDVKGILQSYNVKSVSDLSGVAVPTIYSWLEGRVHKPRLDTIVKVADALGYELRLVVKGATKLTKKHLRVVK